MVAHTHKQVLENLKHLIWMKYNYLNGFFSYTLQGFKYFVLLPI